MARQTKARSVFGNIFQRKATGAWVVRTHTGGRTKAGETACRCFAAPTKRKAQKPQR